jgi:hypothetical protein
MHDGLCEPRLTGLFSSHEENHKIHQPRQALENHNPNGIKFPHTEIPSHVQPHPQAFHPAKNTIRPEKAPKAPSQP